MRAAHRRPSVLLKGTLIAAHVRKKLNRFMAALSSTSKYHMDNGAFLLYNRL